MKKEKADAKFDRQTEKAKKIYKRNEFEAVGKDGAYVDPDKAAGIKSDRAEKELEQNQMQKILDSNLPLAEREKQVNAIRSKSKFYNDKILSDKEKSPNQMLNMEKPNRAGTPVRMLKSMEDKTPMKYKSVRKAERENLMSALAKQGEPIGTNDLGANYNTPSKSFKAERKPLKPASEIKSNTNFATPGTEFKATKPGESNQPKRVTVGDRAKESVKKAVKFSVSAALKKGEPKKKQMTNDFVYEPGSHYDKKDFGTGNINTKSGKAKITKTKPRSKGGKVKMDRKVSTKF